MTSQNINHEILVFINTSFSKRELCEMDEATGIEDKKSTAWQLEKACWSGLLFQMIPDVFNKNTPMNYLWEITLGGQFIRVILGPAPGSVETRASIDPHSFLHFSTSLN